LYLDWKEVIVIYPELYDFGANLDKIAFRLGYAYRAFLLETREFGRGAVIANEMEKVFLKTYFGTNQTIVSLAKHLIDIGSKAAAKSLNEQIRIFGSTPEQRAVAGIMGYGIDDSQANFNENAAREARDMAANRGGGGDYQAELAAAAEAKGAAQPKPAPAPAPAAAPEPSGSVVTGKSLTDARRTLTRQTSSAATARLQKSSGNRLVSRGKGFTTHHRNS
jgi:hypothetical protein